MQMEERMIETKSRTFLPVFLWLGAVLLSCLLSLAGPMSSASANNNYYCQVESKPDCDVTISTSDSLYAAIAKDIDDIEISLDNVDSFRAAHVIVTPYDLEYDIEAGEDLDVDLEVEGVGAITVFNDSDNSGTKVEIDIKSI
ncbi:MAG: hypothetical protein F6K54_36740 [Okeania sp. SIO3B5]|uniref:hypothetical protein n=1 Tax=Okeania sp. SIO3B5 TaxID=2607811 RepID=UPI00140179D4|nr:hypothetical protein [Okeania sp. SIO3B5]NEO58118.1 hypothetical protein [Okeania sp. SIO3B5]